uniref:Phosphatidylinositol glycan, class C n=1 Tax=Enterobius vermicularis TaxID=51028 RepID=A0A0N4VI06_ENTVE
LALCQKHILYEKQPFPDNYAGGAEFLKELKTNMAVVKYTWLEAACGASRVILHENAIVAYMVTFENLMDLPSNSCYALLAVFSVVAVLLYVIHILISGFAISRICDHFYSLITLLLFGYALTPVISTLTTTISTDTIYAMSISLFMFSFIFHDYGLDAAIVSEAFSVNLSLAASVCLVSRIESCEIAFCLLAFSMALFSYWPKLRNRLCQRYDLVSLLMVSMIFPVTLFYLYRTSPPLSAVHLFLNFFIVLVAPWILVKMQPLKR